MNDNENRTIVKEFKLIVLELPRIDTIVRDIFDSVNDRDEGHVVISAPENGPQNHDELAREALLGHVLSEVAKGLVYNLEEVKSYDG